jgi:hypothetical protein
MKVRRNISVVSHACWKHTSAAMKSEDSCPDVAIVALHCSATGGDTHGVTDE